MRVLVAMSGGVDSSVAALLLAEAGHDVVGATMKLWAGPSDSGCCSVADVDDARAVADRLGLVHHVFNFSADFDARVVDPYVADHAAGRTPNPCVECNRHLKFDRFLRRARQLGFDAIATGHHARVLAPSPERPGRGWALARGADRAKDQSYVLHMLGQAELPRVLLPVGELGKADVRARAASAGLRTATKPDSQDVCFVSGPGGRAAFLGARLPLRAGTVVDDAGRTVGRVDAVELVTVGQRRGLGNPGGTLPAGGRRYAVDVDLQRGVVTVGAPDRLLAGDVALAGLSWVDGPPEPGERLEVQCSAHGAPLTGVWEPTVAGGTPPAGGGVGAPSGGGGGEEPRPARVHGRIVWEAPSRRVAPGQSVVLYRGDLVVGGGQAVAG
ncbi:MAG TPA: tRNA 2-thiouridine(34) synthase MnmA [Acidimicrobiales bacterium]|nr:tRNA 2-thiouridine(34) synthase MnmA [Acidimicrobiales bacterium]